MTFFDRPSCTDNSWVRWAYAMAAAFLFLSGVSYFRLWYIGTPNLDGLPVDLPWEIVRRSSFFVAMAVACVSFFKLYFAKFESVSLKDLLKASVLIQIAASFTLPFTTNDLFSYVMFGKLSYLGFDIGKVGPTALPADDIFRLMVSPRWINMPSVYGVVLERLGKILVVPNNLYASMAIYKVAMLVISIATTTVVYLICKGNPAGFDGRNSFVLFAMNPVFIWEFASQAHNDILMLLGVSAFVLFLLKGNQWAAFICILFACVVKLAVLPVLGLYLCYVFFSSKKHFAIFLIMLILGGSFAAIGFSEKLMIVLAPPSSGGIDVTRITGTPLFLLHKFLEPLGTRVHDFAYNAYWVSGMILMGVIGICFAWRSRSVEKLFKHCFLFILLFNLIASPMYQAWYAAWLLPFAFALGSNAMRKFFVIYSAISVLQYPILTSLTGGVINILTLIFFLVVMFYKPASREFSA